jgi:two-component system sensor kinase FixL
MIEVEDSGIGLDPTSIDQIFESMFTTKADGMGMGLSISRSIVAAHGGRLWASPRDGSGQSFASFCVPNPPPTQQADRTQQIFDAAVLQ